ncbi:MAG: NAD-dependent epimerase/dehydratase family protein [Planctomycetes bacterium]|nr:NAD-dependent epimerase/dehydratase family protein [Planctomycetota bacterium]
MAQTELPEVPDGVLLVTGASGFLGGRCVRELLRVGVPPSRLRCLVRDPGRAVRAGLPAASCVAGDLAASDEGPLVAAAAGVTAVLHFAGSLKGIRAADFDAVNVAGTQRLVRAVQAGAPGAHFVLVSSLAAAGPSCDGATSALPAERTRPVSMYGASKRRGELEVVGSGLLHTILRPPIVYGPGDAATRLLFKQSTAPLVFVPRRAAPVSVIHADDVVAAVLRALAASPRGLVLPLDGPERSDMHALSVAIADACGRRARLVRVPLGLVAVAAHAADLWARLWNRPGYFSRDKLREVAAVGWVCDPQPAAEALGFRASIGLATGLAEVAAAEGFRSPRP